MDTIVKLEHYIISIDRTDETILIEPKDPSIPSYTLSIRDACELITDYMVEHPEENYR